MDKAPETPPTSSARRSQKRPHSPQDERTLPMDSKSQTTDPGGSILDSETKTNKLLRLLGGKKRKNETAASKWLERVRSREDELKVSTELESQFNESLTHKLTGQSRRHVGIGFHEETTPPSHEKTEQNSDNNTQKGGDANLKTGDNGHPRGASGALPNPDSAPKGILDSLSGKAQRPGIYGKTSVLRPQGPRFASAQTENSQGYHMPRPPGGANISNVPEKHWSSNTGGMRFVQPAAGYENSLKYGSSTYQAQNAGSLAQPYGYGQNPAASHETGYQYSSMVPPSGYRQSYNARPSHQKYSSTAPPPVQNFVPAKPQEGADKPNPTIKSKSAFYSQFKKAS